MDLMRFVVFLVIFLILFVFGIGLSVNFPHSADDKYASVFKSSIAGAQEISGTDQIKPITPITDTSDRKQYSNQTDESDGSDEKDTDDGFWSGLNAFFGELINILKKPLELITGLLEKIISGLDMITNMISDVFQRSTDLSKQISENVSISVESVKSIPVFGDVIAKILLMLVSILTIFFIIKIIDVLLP